MPYRTSTRRLRAARYLLLNLVHQRIPRSKTLISLLATWHHRRTSLQRGVQPEGYIVTLALFDDFTSDSSWVGYSRQETAEPSLLRPVEASLPGSLC